MTQHLTCRQTRDFSSRYCSILAPSMAPLLLKWMSMYFPKRLELSLRIVLAFPKAEGICKTTHTAFKHKSATMEWYYVCLGMWHTRIRFDIILTTDNSCLTFEDWRGLQHLLLDPGVLAAYSCQELQDQLCALRLSSSRLPTVTHIQPINTTQTHLCLLVLAGCDKKKKIQQYI